MSDEPDFIYSGIVKEGGALSSDFLWVRIQRNIDGLLIQSTADYPVKIEVRLTEQQADGLYRCLHNALRRWSGKEP